MHPYFFFFFFHYIILHYCCTCGTRWHLQMSLQYTIQISLQYTIVEFTPSIILLYPLSPDFQNSLNRSHFSIFIYEYIIFSSSYTPSLYPPPSHWYQSPKQDLFYLPALHFCLFKIALQGIFLWHFHAYIYYNLNSSMPSIFILSTSVPFLWWFQ
jgi:hypothetical protein